MLPNEWVSMGGDTCFENGSCADCAASEFDLVKKIGQEKADAVFQQHWETWFAESDVKAISDAKLNTVRVPVSLHSLDALTTSMFPIPFTLSIPADSTFRLATGSLKTL